MKKLVFLFAGSLITIAGMAQDSLNRKAPVGELYCFVIEDGVAMVKTSSGVKVTSPITMADGTIVNPDATVIKGGIPLTLNAGQCVEASGDIILNATPRKEKK